MKKINTYLWQITAKTNLHVGNEDISSCGIIDKAVQRDALTKLPCINASSLKGALNEFCCGLEDLDDKVRMEYLLRDRRYFMMRSYSIFLFRLIICLIMLLVKVSLTL